MFDVPAGLHEFHRQPVEQVGMRRGLALRADIVEHSREAAPEVMFPKPVDEYAGGQRVVVIHQPLGQPDARGALGERRSL